MTRVVLDTNVFASATIVKDGTPGEIVQAWLRGMIELITSPVLLEELEEVLSRPGIQKFQYMKPEEVKDFIAHLKRAAILVSGECQVQLVREDPDDDNVLSAALEGRADYIVSGDRHLLKLGKYRDIRIVKPTDFLKVLIGK